MTGNINSRSGELNMQLGEIKEGFIEKVPLNWPLKVEKNVTPKFLPPDHMSLLSPTHMSYSLVSILMQLSNRCHLILDVSIIRLDFITPDWLLCVLLISIKWIPAFQLVRTYSFWIYPFHFVSKAHLCILDYSCVRLRILMC